VSVAVLVSCRGLRDARGAMWGGLLADIQRWESLARLTVVMTSGRGVAARGCDIRRRWGSFPEGMEGFSW
jgi:hypothetical protein